jgi:membrane-associated protease RseP (regulator of RpoE activity)
MLDISQTEQYTPIVARFLKIDDITRGDEKQGFLVRYRGQLYGDSAEAYDQLSELLRVYRITPLFRQENDTHVILLTDGVANPGRSNPWINVILFVATVFSVIFAGAMFTYDGPTSDNFWGGLLVILRNMRLGIPYAIALLSILLAHEFGHYLMGRFHKTHVTLPYFLPLPISPFGTMGAAIQMKERPKNKRILLDIGIAGPIAGLVVAIPVLLYGLSISQVSQIHAVPGSGLQIEGNSILYLLSKYIVFRQWLPSPSTYGDLPPFIYWLRYFFTGKPLPVGGFDVMISPIAWAGWAGLLVTALNLIPAGQLDGGHLLFSWIGKRAQMLWPFILAALLVMGIFWSGWWLWALLIFLLGRLYAEPLDQITQLNPGRKAVAIFGLVLFILVFTPVPLTIQMFG